jgi:RNA polymerase sigma-70 factor (ECF subfamily)
MREAAAAFELAAGDLAAHVARHGADPARAIDLAVALGCARKNRHALEAIERILGAELPGALSRLRMNAAEVDEIGSHVREKLLVGIGPGGTPKILDYAGKGSLVSWLRAVIVRAGIDHRRRQGLEPASSTGDGDPLMHATAASDDPELENIRARYAEPFREAFRDALGALDVDERNVLRLYAIEGMNIDQIGTLYGVHRATIARWIQSARARLVDETRRLLSERLRIDRSEFESLVRLCRSRIDLTFSDVDASEA